MSKIGAAVYCLYALSCAATGWASDRWILAGQSPNLARKAFIVTGMLGTAGCMFVTAAATPTAAVLTLLAAGVFFGLCTPMVFVIAQTLAGPRAAGQWMGVQNFFGNLSGIFGPVLTGFLIDRTGNFFWAIAVAGAIALIGAFAYGIAIPRVETLEWPEPMRPPAGIRRRPYFI
jgi:MFS family permease